MILTDNTSRLVVDLVSWDGDAYITVAIDSRGYCGRNDLHVLADEFKLFCRNFIELQKTLKGRAVLNSVSPGELSVIIEPHDALGHISIVGKCGHHIYTSHGANWHSVEFGFEVEPQQLDRAVKVEWVAKYGI